MGLALKAARQMVGRGAECVIVSFGAHWTSRGTLPATHDVMGKDRPRGKKRRRPKRTGSKSGSFTTALVSSRKRAELRAVDGEFRVPSESDPSVLAEAGELLSRMRSLEATALALTGHKPTLLKRVCAFIIRQARAELASVPAWAKSLTDSQGKPLPPAVQVGVGLWVPEVSPAEIHLNRMTNVVGLSASDLDVSPYGPNPLGRSRWAMASWSYNRHQIIRDFRNEPIRDLVHQCYPTPSNFDPGRLLIDMDLTATAPRHVTACAAAISFIQLCTFYRPKMQWVSFPFVASGRLIHVPATPRGTSIFKATPDRGLPRNCCPELRLKPHVYSVGTVDQAKELLRYVRSIPEIAASVEGCSEQFLVESFSVVVAAADAAMADLGNTDGLKASNDVPSVVRIGANKMLGPDSLEAIFDQKFYKDSEKLDAFSRASGTAREHDETFAFLLFWVISQPELIARIRIPAISNLIRARYSPPILPKEARQAGGSLPLEYRFNACPVHVDEYEAVADIAAAVSFIQCCVHLQQKAARVEGFSQEIDEEEYRRLAKILWSHFCEPFLISEVNRFRVRRVGTQRILGDIRTCTRLYAEVRAEVFRKRYEPQLVTTAGESPSSGGTVSVIRQVLGNSYLSADLGEGYSWAPARGPLVSEMTQLAEEVAESEIDRLNALRRQAASDVVSLRHEMERQHLLGRVSPREVVKAVAAEFLRPAMLRLQVERAAAYLDEMWRLATDSPRTWFDDIHEKWTAEGYRHECSHTADSPAWQKIMCGFRMRLKILMSTIRGDFELPPRRVWEQTPRSEVFWPYCGLLSYRKDDFSRYSAFQSEAPLIDRIKNRGALLEDIGQETVFSEKVMEELRLLEARVEEGGRWVFWHSGLPEFMRQLRRLVNLVARDDAKRRSVTVQKLESGMRRHLLEAISARGVLADHDQARVLIDEEIEDVRRPQD